MVALTFGALTLAATVLLVVAIATSKRRDVSWPSLLLAGPFVPFNPDKYLRPERAPRVLLLTIAWFVLLALTGIASAIQGF
jgi:hypothetical protein